MRLAFADERLRQVCQSSELLFDAWGPAWEQVATCLTLLAQAARFGDLRTFACLQIEIAVAGGEVVAAAARTVLVAHERAQVALRAIDEQGRTVPEQSAESDLDFVTRVQVLDISCNGRTAWGLEAS